MRAKKIIWILLCTLFLCNGCHQSPSQTIGQKEFELNQAKLTNENIVQNTTENISQHIKKEITGQLISVNIDIDVEYKNKHLNIYTGKPIQVDMDAWYGLFFPNTDQSELTHIFDLYPDKQKKSEGITDEDYKTEFAYFFDDQYVMYTRNQASFFHRAGDTPSKTESYITYDPDITSQDAELIATSYIEKLFGQSDYQLYDYDIVKDKDKTINDPFHTLYYKRYIDGLPVVIDYIIKDSADFEAAIYNPDLAEVWINDTTNQISLALITYRNLEEIKGKGGYPIPIDRVLAILETYIDTINALPSSDEDIFEIKHFALGYYPLDYEPKVNVPDWNQTAYVTYIPVWYIASGTRTFSSAEFVMIIDAITGDIIA